MVSQGLASKGDIHFESIWFKAFLSPQRTNVTHGQIISWIIYRNGQRFSDTKNKFNASRGEEYFARGTEVALTLEASLFQAFR